MLINTIIKISNRNQHKYSKIILPQYKLIKNDENNIITDLLTSLKLV